MIIRDGTASSASVFSALIAANATFALNAGLWFRRGRLLMGLSCLGHYAKVRQKLHLSNLCKNLEPVLASVALK